MHAFVVKPPDFSPAKKYPVLFLIHGGPQGSWGESWTYRWNAQVFAGAGYLVVMPNPRGSTGYGQKFIDEISGDWGGKPYDDIMAVVDSVAALPYADPARMAAAGGSYGGYMVDWMLGHTNRFKAFVSHDGVFDLRSMAAETEELWFVQWEFRGMPWDNPELYAKWSPSYFVKDFKTPTLVIHGEQDFRVPVSQGMQLFTALQSQKVPSKLLLFPDEGHWVLKPQNTVLWYSQFLDWIGEWTKRSSGLRAAAFDAGAQLWKLPGSPPAPEARIADHRDHSPPARRVEISSELTLAPGAHDLEIVGNETRLKAADNFKGRAILVIENAERIHLHYLEIDGNRQKLAKPLEMAPPENAFRVWYPDNGVLVNQVAGLQIERLHLTNVGISPSWSANPVTSAFRTRPSRIQDRRMREGGTI